MDDPYFSKPSILMRSIISAPLGLIPLLELLLGPSYYKPLQTPTLNELFYLVLQVKTFICVVTVVFVESAVLVL